MAAAVAAAASMGVPPRVEARPVDPPRAMVVRPSDGERHAGAVVRFDDAGLRLRTSEGETLDMAWDRFEPREVNRLYRGLLPEGEAVGPVLLELAVVLRDLDGEDSRLAETALRQAVRLDPALRDAAEAIRRGERERTVADDKQATPEAAGDRAATTREGVDHGPRVSGAVLEQFWGELSAEVMQASVADRKAFVEQAQRDMDHPLQLHETEYFLFYSDLPRREAERWAGLLDKMYRRLADLFAVPDQRNIFRGKAVIFVFQREADYHRFNAIAHQTPSVGSAGLCHGFGDGHVHISFFRQDNQWLFAHILVHESVHGFVHRYRSPRRVPSWVNEGLAEYIATQLVPQARVREGRLRVAHHALREYRSFGAMFDLPHIEGWQYGAALDLTEFMVDQSRKRYAAFVNGIKDGATWRQSLNERYGVSLERLLNAYERTIHVRGLEP